jgi:hypothetical protein
VSGPNSIGVVSVLQFIDFFIRKLSLYRDLISRIVIKRSVASLGDRKFRNSTTLTLGDDPLEDFEPRQWTSSLVPPGKESNA